MHRLRIITLIVWWSLGDVKEGLNKLSNQFLREEFIKFDPIVGTLENYWHECEFKHRVFLLV